MKLEEARIGQFVIFWGEYYKIVRSVADSKELSLQPVSFKKYAKRLTPENWTEVKLVEKPLQDLFNEILKEVEKLRDEVQKKKEGLSYAESFINNFDY